MITTQVLKKLFLFSLFWFFFSIIFNTPASAAVTLFLDPPSDTFDIGENFEVLVKLNTGGAKTVGVDALMNFDPAILQLKGLSFGTLYSENNENLTKAETTGGFYFSSANLSSAVSFSNSTAETLATLKFTAKAAGTSQVTFKCTAGSLVDTNVWEQGTRGGDAVDLLICTNATGGSYQVEGAGVTSTPTPTTQPGPTATPTPGPSPTPTPTPLPGTPTSTPTPAKELPVAGGFENTAILSIIGGGLVLLGLALAF